MSFLIVGGILVTVMVIWWYTRDSGEVKEVIITNKEKKPGLLKRWRSKFNFRKSSKDLPLKFKEWIAEAIVEEAQAETFTAWLVLLSNAELIKFNNYVDDFCTSLNLQLTWLIDNQLDNNPELKQALGELVVFYSLAYWKAVEAENDILLFSTFQNWKKGKGDKALTQQLFARLVEKGLIIAPPPDLFLSPEKERQAHMRQAINRFANKDMELLNIVLGELLSIPKSKPPVPIKKEKTSEEKPAEETAKSTKE